MKTNLFFSFLISFMVFSTTPAVAENFQTSDLEGTWYMFDTTVDPAQKAVYWTYGEFEADASGSVVSGTYYAPNGSSFIVTDGQMMLDKKGVMSGAATVDMGGGITATAMFPHGKLDQSKTSGALLSLMTVEGSPDPPSMGIGSFIKGGGTFTQADIAGEWHAQGTMIDLTQGAVIPVSGTFILDEFGNLVSGSYFAPNGITATVVPAGSKIEVNEDGLSSGNVNIEINFGPPTGIVPLVSVMVHGKMDQGKKNGNYVTMDFVDPNDPNTLVSLTNINTVKGGGTFATTDLAGSWYTYSLGMDYSNMSNPAIYWLRGEYQTDSSGNISNGFYVAPDGTVIQATGGMVSLDSAGELSGNITIEGGQSTTVSGKLGESRSYGIFGSVDTGGGFTTGVMIKDTYSFPWSMFLPAFTGSDQ